MAYPYGYTIFCDDIRDEIGGKVTFVGTYRNALLIHGDFPFTLSQLAMSISFVTQANLRPERLPLRVYLPGDPEDSPSIVGELAMGDAEILADPNLPPVKERDPT